MSSVSSAPTDRPRPRVAVVVLGDLGRSPRMQYHALALARRLADVELIGLAGSDPIAAVRGHPHIRLQLIDDRDAPNRRGIAAAVLRAARHAIALLRALLAAPPLDAILVQNPPALPTLAIALLAARRHRARLIVDWHNLGHAMLGLRLGAGHPLVRLTAACERGLGSRADSHLAVSRAMRTALAERWGIDSTVLRDRPASRFAALAPIEREAAARALAERFGFDANEPRPPIAITATSWSADEDFDLLLEAMAAYEALAGAQRLLLIVSGRGPRRADYEERIARLALRRIRVSTVWVSPAEYPALLAASDLGFSLHRSASGLDLPMKIADMFGAGLPVLALDYGACLREMVEPGENALLFSTGRELAERWDELFSAFPTAANRLDRLRANAARAAAIRWEDGWEEDAAPLFGALLEGKLR